MYLVLVTALIGLIPWPLRLQRILYEYGIRVCFRIMTRTFSTVITYHNRQHRPRRDGICVANHTTPVDVLVLQCDRTYALVN